MKNWTESLLDKVAPHAVQGRYLVALLDNNGKVEIGKSYSTDTVAHQQASRLGNEERCNSYVVCRYGERVAVYVAPKTLLIAAVVR